ncbi:synaptic transmission protein complexin isoform X2 [Cotesia typhae]|uniref:synaptic transmission protein complexin isoform X2 n=1 Tax=Cotesia typhae TaxID=2053667 RepID=UPI003D69CD0C
MAAFVAKQMVGNKLNAVKGAVGGEGGDEDDKEKEEEAERERQEAIKEAEERRKEKHRKMEEEREKMRQEIRDKYNIKKREEIQEITQEEPNPLMRKKKTPEELAAEAEAEEQDEFTTERIFFSRINHAVAWNVRNLSRACASVVLMRGKSQPLRKIGNC